MTNNNFSGPEGADYEHEAARCQGRRVTVWLAVFLGLVFAAAALVANAAEVFRSTDDKGGQAFLRIHEEPCSNEAVQAQLLRMQIAPHFLERFNRATLFYWGREWASCWIEYNGQVLSVDEEGSPFQPIPRAAFKDDGV